MPENAAQYIVLKPGIGRAAYEKAANELGLVKQKERPGDGQKESFQQIWATADGANFVIYVEDPITDTNFFSVRGPKLKSLMRELRMRVFSFAPEELVELAQEAETHQEQVEAVSRLAVGFPEYEPEVFEIFSAYATKAPNPQLRAATVNAIGYRCWPECIPLLEGIIRNDSDAQVRETAERLLPYLRQAAARRGT